MLQAFSGTSLRSILLDCNWHSCLSIAITSPHTTIFKPLLFPDLHSLLYTLKALLTRCPTSLAMRRRDRYQDALFSDVHSTQSMRDSDGDQVMLAKD